MTSIDIETPATLAHEVDVKSLIDGFVPADGWEVPSTLIAERVKSLWITEEAPNASLLATAIAKLKRAAANPGSLQGWATSHWDMTLRTAEKEFNGMVREAVNNRKKNRIRHEKAKAHAANELTRLKAERGEAKNAVDLELVGLTGTTNAEKVHTPKQRTILFLIGLWLLNVIQVLATVVAEVIVGKPQLEVTSRPTQALTLVVGLAVAVFVIIHFTMPKLRRLITRWSAGRRFKKAANLPDGAQVFLFPTADKIIAVLGTLAIIVAACGAFAYRIWIAQTTEAGVASDVAGDMASPWGLMFIVFMSAGTAYIQATNYAKEQYADLDKLRAVLAAATQAVKDKEREVSEFDKWNLFDSYEDDLLAAKRQYDDSINEAKEKIEGEAAALENHRTMLFPALHQYEARYELYSNVFLSALNAFLKGAEEKAAEKNRNKAPKNQVRLPKMDTALAAKIRGLFKEKAPAKYLGADIDALADSVRSLEFRVVYEADKQIADFETIIDGIERELDPANEPEIEPLENRPLGEL